MPVLHSNFKTIKIWLFSIILLTGLLIGCASNEKFPPLESARQAYSNAEANPDVKTNAPVAFYEAGKALEKAEKAENLDEKQHISYLAEKNSEMAVALAEQKKAEKEMSLLKKEKGEVILESRRVEMEQAKSAAATSAGDARAAREESMKLKTEAETKTRDAMAAREEVMKLKTEAEAEAKTRAAREETMQLKTEAKAREAQESQAKAAQLETELANLKAVKTDRGMVLTLGDVLFDSGKSDLAPGARQTMDYLAAFLNKYPDRKVQIEGHTDSTGSAELNQNLSERRAQSVKIALLKKGVSFDRITTVGYGKDRPVTSNDTPSGRQQNRRVEIVISNPNDPAVQTK
jgi:outer membrane protein OmpA-like peptidoglycan-associated protein